MALSRSLRSQMTQLDARRSEVQQVQSPTLRMMMASPEESRVNQALGALTFMGGGQGGGTPDTGGAALGAIPSGFGTFDLGDVGGAEANPDGSVPSPQAGGESVRGFDDMIDPGQDRQRAELQASMTGQVGGDPSDAGGGGPTSSTAGALGPGPTPAEVAGFGRVGVGPLSSNALSLGSKVAGLLGSPLAAAALGLPGLAMQGFQTAVGTAGKIANHFGVQTSQNMLANAVNSEKAGIASGGFASEAAFSAAVDAAATGIGQGQGFTSVTSDPASSAIAAALSNLGYAVSATPTGYAVPAGLGPNGLTQHQINSLANASPRTSVDPNTALGRALGLRGAPDVTDPDPNIDVTADPNGPDADTDVSADAGVPSGLGIAANIGLGLGEPDGGAPDGGAVSDGSGVGAYARGGVVGKDARPGKSTSIAAHEDEYVVRAEPSKKYRRLLEAINQDRPQQVSQLARALVG